MKKVVVLGSLNMDYVINVEKMPQKGETILGLSMSKTPGGKGANQAYAIGKLGGKVSMIGAVGEDENGKILKKNLNSVGVNTEGIMELAGVCTGNAVITVDKAAENSIIVLQGANARLTKTDIDANKQIIVDSDVLVMQLEIPVEVVEYAARIASESGTIVILDPAPAAADLPDTLWQCIDVIKPNETELAALSGMPVTCIEDAAIAAKSLLKKGVTQVIVTMGDEGSLLVTEDKTQHFPGEKVVAIDTTAAGDSFTAAFVVAVTNGKSCEEAISYGNRVSAITVTRKGAQASIPDKEEVAF